MHHYIAKITVGPAWVDQYHERLQKGLPHVLVQAGTEAVYCFGIQAESAAAVRELLEPIVPELLVPPTGVTLRIVQSKHSWDSQGTV